MAFFRSKTKMDLTELVRACQRQDSRAQVIFYDRYKSRLLGICVRYAKTVAEAEDIFQEGIMKIFSKIDEISKPESVDSWVKTIMIRHAIDYYHQVTKKEILSSSYENTDIDWPVDDHGSVLQRMDVQVLLETINALPDGYRIVVNLYFVDGYKHSEIAQMLGIMEATSRSQLTRGRNLLFKLLEQKGIKQHEIL
ncbi:RNA polymerase sigma factor [Dyadobacter fanqingshengii]|uniref:RNA polymerase sigma factor n=1 Tax=Dyadobacter fanqingshengii TaxID=2906443 RepID=A0A9X1PBZ2_9BACT|nr:RNA polymerase sigma factor [Dyadobacter fanqingshengii]MCF0040853.1 RNA polymerase sigma factor [Dyadobacter fanqingshengii]MCF2506042.1 RNA polymerase sigma factor [Dyadobacter fanqingshengii]USJ37414.1 RNA polymerase sigma factor [Dyadobacter fanqingshengii]